LVVLVITEFAADGFVGVPLELSQPLTSVTETAVASAAAAVIEPTRGVKNGTWPTVPTSSFRPVWHRYPKGSD
jgi:hypothetical protein